MARTVLIIGNGFDIELGLQSSYSQFAMSPEWKDLVRNKIEAYNLYQAEDSLVLFIEKARLKDNWFDIELCIHDFISAKYSISKDTVKIVKSDFEDLKSSLQGYLCRITDDYNLNKESNARLLLSKVVGCPFGSYIASFNYTDSLRLCDLQRDPSITDFTYIHGNLNTGIVLGCDKFDNENVNRTLSFLYKYNMLNKTNHIVASMRQSREIVFYGHSVNEMDFSYFKDFFMYVSKPLAPYPPRRLTFITKDEDSIRDIKDNMRNQGISLVDMYCNLETFDFILSSQINIPNSESSKKWKKLIERIVDHNDKTK